MSDGKLTGVALGAAVIFLAAWLALLAWLAFNTGMSDAVQWARLESVLGSLEAIAFAAAGALFGTTVQKQRVEAANQRADSAQQTAQQNVQAALNGRALAKAIQTQALATATAHGAENSRGFNVAEPHVQLAGLVELAKELFPD